MIQLTFRRIKRFAHSNILVGVIMVILNYKRWNVSSDLFMNAINTINIISCGFTDNSNHNGGLVLIDISGSANCDVYISDTTISYSQYLETELLNIAFPPNGIVINNPSRNTYIQMNDVIIITQIYCSYDNIYVDVGRRRNLLQAYAGPPDIPFCNSPTPFLLNNGISKLTNISLQTDYYWYNWYLYFYSNGNTDGEYRNSGVYFLRLEYYDTTLETDNEPYFAAIVNFEDGIMDINDFNIAIGAHFSILYNQEGIVNINGLYSELHDDQSRYYNRWNLRFYTILTNNFGTLSVSNSVIQGADISLINIYGGDVSITDCILAQSMLNIVTYYTANRIYLHNINVYEVGQYYASLGAALYFSRSHEELYYIPATFLSADIVTILNSVMYYIGPFGILEVGKYGLFNIDDGNTNIKKVTILNNSLLVTETLNNNQTDLALYKGYKYFINFDYLSSLLSQTYGESIPISRMLQFISDINTQLWNVNGLLIIDNQYELILGNNFMHLDNKNFIGINSQIYIDTTQENCIAGNKIYNIDFYMKSGKTKSCIHRNIETAQINLYYFIYSLACFVYCHFFVI
eukprot:230586_1